MSRMIPTPKERADYIAILEGFPQYLVKLRERSQLSTQEFGAAMNTSYSQVWRVETGKISPSLNFAIRAFRLDLKLSK